MLHRLLKSHLRPGVDGFFVLAPLVVVIHVFRSCVTFLLNLV